MLDRTQQKKVAKKEKKKAKKEAKKKLHKKGKKNSRSSSSSSSSSSSDSESDSPLVDNVYDRPAVPKEGDSVKAAELTIERAKMKEVRESLPIYKYRE